MELGDNKILNVGLLLAATLLIAKLVSALIMPRSNKRLPPVIKSWPLIGGLIRFLKGPVVMLREEYPKLGSVFTLNLLNKNITFFIGPEVSAHFFKAPETDLSQQEVYQFNVPTFGPGVVFDVDYTIRQEQFRFFTESLRVTKLKGYVDQMVMEAETIRQEQFRFFTESLRVTKLKGYVDQMVMEAESCMNGFSGHVPETDLSQQEVYQFNVPTLGPGVVFDVDYTIRQEQFRFKSCMNCFSGHGTLPYYYGVVCLDIFYREEYFSKWGDSGEVDLKYELEHLIILTASRCLLGEEVRNKLFDDVSALFHDLDNGMLPISVIFPYLPIPAHRRRDNARKKLAEIFATIINSRKRKAENDMLQCFIDSKYKDGRLTTESEITGLLIAALFAGQHTSSITSTWTGAYLLCNNNYMSAVVDEQKNLMKKHGNKVDHDILSEMEVLYRCIKEALRLHPPLIMLLRSSHSDFSVTTREGKEYDIPKGHIVATSPAFANRLPHIYKNPASYDPDRFAPGREEDKAAGAFSYISFGGGRHGCLGEPFAYLQIKAIWSHLLRNFEFELISPFPEIDWNAMVVGVKGEVMVKYKRRKLYTELADSVSA
ncbi:hypothetical protein RND71_007241 [Anisodus tanguticus]|uniref:sterol 14alpha-demethylase n=1 Tax=Anisodus tanguticus TaxID=243964 RepID=A0AAE1VJY3_9SOLA|nr:hypothetical protein RND71_007241 [Anisodus tanguticus]